MPTFRSASAGSDRVRRFGPLLLAAAVLTFPLAARGAEPGWLGVYIRPATAADGQGAVGVVVNAVVADGPAEKAGLRAADRIVAVDGRPVATFDELRDALRSRPADGWIGLAVERKGEELSLDARLGAAPSGKRLEVRRGWIGVESIDLPPSLRTHFGAPADAGVMIAEVADDGPALAAGLEIGDVVFEVDDEPVRTADELLRRVHRGGVGNTLELRLVRYGAEIVLETTIDDARNASEADDTKR